MFGLGTQELIIILLIAFFVFGGKKLPEIGAGLGKGLRAFKSGLSDLESEKNHEKSAIDVDEKGRETAASHNQK
ncbi:MAG TPA: twin-arginine translocase TatA/TatE family subunit [Thermodesulfobacteriaceae bacterium]|nr:twin-arginine translocase TatA/TatE family subunit [Thermodesulfobacteriaceae bacterium]